MDIRTESSCGYISLLQKKDYKKKKKGTYKIIVGNIFNKSNSYNAYFSPNNDYNIEFKEMEKDGKLLFSNSNVNLKGIKLYARVKSLMLKVSNGNVNIDLSDGVYGVPNNIEANEILLNDYSFDENNPDDLKYLKRLISCFKAYHINLIDCDKKLLKEIYEEDNIYKVDLDKIRIFERDKTKIKK